MAAIAAVLVAAGVGFALVGHGHSGTAFAKEDALGAIRPRPGYVIHAKIRQEGVNDVWLDLAGDREHSIDRSADGTITSEFVLDGSRCRFKYVNPLYPDQGMMVDETYGSNAGGGELQPYEYVREALPEGQVVRSITLHGQAYWDVYWSNVKDSGGMKLTAHAQFRKSDYAPALIERTYAGSSSDRWEVLSWDVVPISSVPSGTFSLSSLPFGKELPAESAWSLADLPRSAAYRAYWAGSAVGSATILTGPLSGGTDPKMGALIKQQTRFHSPLNAILGESCTAAEYVGDDPKASVTVLSGSRLPDSALAEKIRARDVRHDVATIAPSEGIGWQTTLADGSVVAGVQRTDATLVVHAGDAHTLQLALEQLKPIR
jgi:hypothetical protein